MTERTLGQVAILAAMLSLAPRPFFAAPTPVSPTAAPKNDKRDMLLMTLSLDDRLIITRMAADGSCRQYLRQGGGFSSVLPSSHRGGDFAATASADGKKLAFYSTRSGAVNLWVSDSDGLNQQALTESDVSIAEFHPLDEPPIQFSPDNHSVAYLQSGNLWICELDGRNPRALTRDGGISAFAWQPLPPPKTGPGSSRETPARLAYMRHGSLRLVGASGFPDELIASDAANFPTLSFNPSFDKHELYYFYNGIWKINTVTKKRERLVGSFCFPNRVRSNPSGDNVAFVSYSSDVREEIFTYASGQKGITQVTQGGASQPAYSKDGKAIYFKRNGGLWRVGLAGEKATRIYDANVFLIQPVQLQLSVPGACP